MNSDRGCSHQRAKAYSEYVNAKMWHVTGFFSGHTKDFNNVSFLFGTTISKLLNREKANKGLLACFQYFNSAIIKGQFLAVRLDPRS